MESENQFEEGLAKNNHREVNIFHPAQQVFENRPCIQLGQ